MTAVSICLAESSIIIIDFRKFKFVWNEKSSATHSPLSLFPNFYPKCTICLMLKNVKESEEDSEKTQNYHEKILLFYVA